MWVVLPSIDTPLRLKWCNAGSFNVYFPREGKKGEGKIFPSPLFNLEEENMFQSEINLEVDKEWGKFPSAQAKNKNVKE